MTHIMVPDGVLAPWLWIAGWAGAAACLALALWATRESDRARLVPLAAVLAGLMTLVMSLEIAPLAYEPHLTVLTGILVGPAYGVLAAFVFNVLRLLLGDGSVTLLGLNTLLLGLETVLGALAFRAAARLLPRSPGFTGLAAALATLASLAASTGAFLAVAAMGSVPLDALAEEGILDRLGTASPQFGAFAATVLVLGLVGWLLEAAIVGAVVAFVRAVRPSLLTAARESAVHGDPAATGLAPLTAR
ncbi:MAG TPA: energy-coupling factor ABC transporter permease [Chloroflexota bacterium]|nr:energy-coupling factor ABC transporter permease [Chloroflexota bacterium]